MRRAFSSGSASKLTTQHLRDAFISYFVKNSHVHKSASPLLATGDPTLLFTNAGMCQFKDAFLGVRAPEHPRVVTVQPCVRAGGKHCDLENVGMTGRHHTLFEMLGNFSFGDYFKEEAIVLAWRFLTRELQLNEEKLVVSVYHQDQEAAQLWSRVLGFGPDRTGVDRAVEAGKLRFLGVEDNFWDMGGSAEGQGAPCGPCSEIFYQVGEPSGIPGCDEHLLELWNLVFMQYSRRVVPGQAVPRDLGDPMVASLSSDLDLQGVNEMLVPLERKCIDTGMGLERIARVVQGVDSTFHIDELADIATDVGTQVSATGNAETVDDCQESLCVLVDHVRACLFLMSEGLVPSEKGAGYVLRRIVRRALNFADRLGLSEPRLSRIAEQLAGGADGDGGLQRTYPDLAHGLSFCLSTLALEEKLYFDARRRAQVPLAKLHAEMQAQSSTVVSGAWVFLLHDTFGFTTDLLEAWATQHGWSVDLEEYTRLRNEARGDCNSLGGASVDIDVDAGGIHTSLPSGPEWTRFLQSVDDVYRTAQAPSSTPAQLAWSMRINDPSTLQAHSSVLALEDGDSRQREVGRLDQLPAVVETWSRAEASSSQEGGRGMTVSHIYRGPEDEASALSDVLVYVGVTDPHRVYTRGGGQVGDIGYLELDDKERWIVLDAVRTHKHGVTVLKCLPACTEPGDDTQLVRGATAQFYEHAGHRQACSVSHTATHLLLGGLRRYFGPGGYSKQEFDVCQAGSLVSSSRLRLDFTSLKSLSDQELTTIETDINDRLNGDFHFDRHAHDSEDEQTGAALGPMTMFSGILSKNDALKAGAVANFDEKYGDFVRVVGLYQPGGGGEEADGWVNAKTGEVFLGSERPKDVSLSPIHLYSLELCGGLHVDGSDDHIAVDFSAASETLPRPGLSVCDRDISSVYPLVIVQERAVSSGVRRVEAVAGDASRRFLYDYRAQVHPAVTDHLGVERTMAIPSLGDATGNDATEVDLDMAQRSGAYTAGQLARWLALQHDHMKQLDKDRLGLVERLVCAQVSLSDRLACQQLRAVQPSEQVLGLTMGPQDCQQHGLAWNSYICQPVRTPAGHVILVHIYELSPTDLYASAVQRRAESKQAVASSPLLSCIGGGKGRVLQSIASSQGVSYQTPASQSADLCRDDTGGNIEHVRMFLVPKEETDDDIMGVADATLCGANGYQVYCFSKEALGGKKKKKKQKKMKRAGSPDQQTQASATNCQQVSLSAKMLFEAVRDRLPGTRGGGRDSFCTGALPAGLSAQQLKNVLQEVAMEWRE